MIRNIDANSLLSVETSWISRVYKKKAFLKAWIALKLNVRLVSSSTKGVFEQSKEKASMNAEINHFHAFLLLNLPHCIARDTCHS